MKTSLVVEHVRKEYVPPARAAKPWPLFTRPRCASRPRARRTAR